MGHSRITKWEKLLRKHYYQPRQKGSFTTVGLKRAVKLKKEKVDGWLKHQDTYTLHKPVKYNFRRRKVIVPGPNHQWQADLVDVSAIKKDNGGYTFLLTVIDVFSKRAWVVPLKNKSASSLVKAFEPLLESNSVKYLQTDQGKEFTNKPLQDLLKKHEVHFFTTYNQETKASIVERFNRTLKTKMWKYFTKKNTRTYLNILDDLVFSYNHTYHRSIGMAPMDVSAVNLEDVWQRLYDPVKRTQPKFFQGDRVRISKAKKTFKKGYLPNWTTEIFTVLKTLRTDPFTYKLVDDKGATIQGTFYEEELQKVGVDKKKLWVIEDVLDEKVVKGKKLVLVKWKGYSDSFNEWIAKASLRKV